MVAKKLAVKLLVVSAYWIYDLSYHHLTMAFFQHHHAYQTFLTIALRSLPGTVVFAAVELVAVTVE